MVFPDVNVYVDALMSGAEMHEKSRAWLQRALAGTEPVAIWEPVLCSVIRVTTRSRVFQPVATVSEAIKFVTAVRTSTVAVVVRPGERFWPILEQLLGAVGTGGNLVTDAMAAAVAIEHDCTLVSSDRDFARFPGLKWEIPS